MKKLFLSEPFKEKDSGRKPICRVMKLTASFSTIMFMFRFCQSCKFSKCESQFEKESSPIGRGP